MSTQKSKSRRQQILESLASMLEASPGGKITTAALAKNVGVSEAALYRHFPSKSKMFEGLIEFIEETIFSQVSLIMSNESDPFERAEKIIYLILIFCERNPGITRILTGDALAGETDRLRQRVVQLFDRLESQLKQVFRDAEIRDGMHFGLPISTMVTLLLSSAEGRIAQFVRSSFRKQPTQHWREQWPYLIHGLVKPSV